MDPVHERETDRRVEAAKASMLARMEELGRRLRDARNKIDLRAHIVAHPQLAVGIAFGLGALLALPGGGKKKSKIPADSAEVKSGLIGAAMATLGSLAFTLLKDVAMRRAGVVALDWWQNRQGSIGGTEAQAPRAQSAEAFFDPSR